MAGEWTRRGLLAACGTSLAAGAGAGAAATDRCSATVATNALTQDGEPKLEVPSDSGVGIPVRTTCPEGAELIVRVQAHRDSSNPFLLTPEATVDPRGRADVVADFTDIDVGTGFKILLIAGDAESRTRIGRLAHGEVVEEPPGEPGPIDGTAPRDVDGDGLYEDLTGNGETDFGDVVELFQHREDPSVAKRVDAYDFDLDGDVDRADVVALFERV